MGSQRSQHIRKISTLKNFIILACFVLSFCLKNCILEFSKFNQVLIRCLYRSIFQIGCSSSFFVAMTTFYVFLQFIILIFRLVPSLTIQHSFLQGCRIAYYACLYLFVGLLSGFCQFWSYAS